MQHIKHLAGIALITIALSACSQPTTPADLTGHIGCPASKITIKNLKDVNNNQNTYEAYCGHVKYYCSDTYNDNGKFTNKQINCSKAQRQ